MAGRADNKPQAVHRSYSEQCMSIAQNGVKATGALLYFAACYNTAIKAMSGFSGDSKLIQQATREAGALAGVAAVALLANYAFNTRTALRNTQGQLQIVQGERDWTQGQLQIVQGERDWTQGQLQIVQGERNQALTSLDRSELETRSLQRRVHQLTVGRVVVSVPAAPVDEAPAPQNVPPAQ